LQSVASSTPQEGTDFQARIEELEASVMKLAQELESKNREVTWLRELMTEYQDLWRSSRRERDWMSRYLPDNFGTGWFQPRRDASPSHCQCLAKTLSADGLRCLPEAASSGKSEVCEE
jgi:hypothetical protein